MVRSPSHSGGVVAPPNSAVVTNTALSVPNIRTMVRAMGQAFAGAASTARYMPANQKLENLGQLIVKYAGDFEAFRYASKTINR